MTLRFLLPGFLSLLLLSGAWANLLEFGAFDDFADGRFAGWQISPKPDFEGKSKAGQVGQSAESSGGSGSSAFFHFSGGGDFRLIMKGRLDIHPDTNYRLTVRTRSELESIVFLGTVYLIPTLEADGKKGKSRSEKFEIRPGPEWKSESFRFRSGANEVALTLHFTFRNKDAHDARLLLDEIILEEAP